MGVLLWPRGSLAGVIVGDGAKDRETNGYTFAGDEVVIKYEQWSAAPIRVALRR